MITSRGGWFLGVIIVLLAVALFANVPAVALGCLTLLLWFLWTWAAFEFRLRLALGRLQVKRVVRDPRRTLDSLWAGRTYTVDVQVTHVGSATLPYARLTDWVPIGATCAGGATQIDGPLSASQPLEFSYQLACPRPGVVRFEGIQVECADLQGFFYHKSFVPTVRTLRVLPALTDAKSHVRVLKERNLLPFLGTHRHRRPGSGSELLDLRDYQPGDPPKMIAWKASARRDRLMTKEFESEVPVRCTFFVDTSNSVRAGGMGQNALARLVEIVAAVAEAASAARDLPGLCLFDEDRVTYLRPARNPRHLIQLFHVLAGAAALAPIGRRAPVDHLLALAYSFADDVYPDLLRSDVNRMPLTMAWFRPAPTFPDRPAPPARHVYFALFLLVVLLPVAGAAMFLSLFVWVVFDFLRDWLGLGWASAAGASLALAFGSVVLTRLQFVYRALPQIFSSRRRRRARWRKQLAALLSMRYGLAPGGLALLTEDDQPMGQYLQRFLAEHQVPFELPLYDARGVYQFAAPAKIEVLAQALVRAVGRGRDNELFVLMVDCLELVDHLGPLLGAVKVALARHHQVLVLCPWPKNMPLPRRGAAGQPSWSRPRTAQGTDPAIEGLVNLSSATVADVLEHATIVRFHRAYHEVRRTFAHLGVAVFCARSEDSVPLILDRLERLRTQERGAP